MGILKRSFAVGAALVLASGCHDSPFDPPLETNVSRERLQFIVDSIVAVNRVPGAVVAVRQAGGAETILASGIDDLAQHTAMNASDRFRVGSVTKTMVATVVLQLADEHALGLDDLVATWLPGVVPNASRITIRQLLNHTSGEFNYTEDTQFLAALGADPQHAWTPEELIAVANSHPVAFPPGASDRWLYSNTNYVLLGMILEKVTGASLSAMLQSRIFDRLALSSTFFATTSVTPVPFSRGYIDFAGMSNVDVASVLSPTSAWAAGAVVSNAHDLATWSEALASGALLSAATQTDRLTVVVASGLDGYGLGVQTFARWVGHAGEIFGYETMMYSKPQVGTIVVLVNKSTAGVAAFQLFNAVRWAKFGTR
jgi:D-alanyl-D-alanine carboxypeptidase